MIEFLFELQIKYCKEVFMEGENPGVIATQIVSFNSAEERHLKDPGLICSLLEQEEVFIKKHIKVNITRKEDNEQIHSQG